MIARIGRWLFDCRPYAVLCFVLGGFIVAVSLDYFAPQATPYWILATCVYLPALIWPGVIVEGIETRCGIREGRKSTLIWTLIGCSVFVALASPPPVENAPDAFRFTSARGILVWMPLLLSACVSLIATRVLTGAENARQSVTTGPVGTFVQFIFLPVCVCFLHSRAQRLAHSSP